jgi:hypothetical protein
MTTNQPVRKMVIMTSFVLGVIIGGTIAGVFVDKEHRQTVFNEQVSKHHCVIQTVYVDGVATKGNTCILPDGTLLRKGD